MSNAKAELIRVIQSQPEDSSQERIVRALIFHVMIRRGLADANAGRTISNDQMGRRMRAW